MPSTVIDTFTYDPETSTLRVNFRSGYSYIYKDVPEQVYTDMKLSGAKGIFLNRNIKGKYEFEKVSNKNPFK